MESTATTLRERWGRLGRLAGRLAPYLAALAFTAGLGLVVARHEMWRDELQAWLIARDSPNPLALLANTKYEGHPALWHLILWIITRFTTNPVAMQVVHVGIAGLSAFLLVRFAPFPVVVRVLIAAGYFFAYEWAVIARNYGLSVLLLFLICALYRDRWRYFPWLGGCGLLLAHTNVFATIITGVLTVTWAIEFAVAYAGKFREADRFWGRALIGFGLLLMGVSTAVIQMKPPADGAFAAEWHFRWTTERRERVATAAVNAFFPLRDDSRDFWHRNPLLQAEPKRRGLMPFIPSERRAAVALAVLGVSALWFFKRPWLVAPLVVGYGGLLAFLYLKYPGSSRHHGFLFLLFVVLLWMSANYTPWRAKWQWIEWPAAWLDRLRFYALVPLLIVHVAGAWTAIRLDWHEPFSRARETAHWLREKYSATHEVALLGDPSPAASAVLGYWRTGKMFYADRGEFGSFVIWDERWRDGENRRRVGDALDKLRASMSGPIVLVLNYRLESRQLQRRCRYLRSFEGATVGDESYHIYECAE